MYRYSMLVLALLSVSAGTYAQVMVQDREQELRDAKHAYELAEKSQATEDSEVARATLIYGRALLRAYKAESSRKILKLALKRYTDLYGSDSPKLISPLLMLAQADALRRRLGQSQRHLKQARKIVVKAFDQTSIDYADSMYRIGRVALTLSLTGAANDDLRSAHQVYALKLDPMAIKLGETRHLLGKLYLHKGKFEEAEPHLQAALEIFDPSDPARLDRHIQVRADWGGALESLGLRDEATVHYVAVGRLQESLSTVMFPLHRVSPRYPMNALAKGASGYVDWQFTVDESGYVVDPKITHTEGTKSFEKASLDVLLKFRYPPRFVDGQAVATPGVTTRISFIVEK